MRVWLPDCVYRSFPLVVGTVGLAGCLAGSPASLALGGVLILYSGGVYCLRRKELHGFGHACFANLY